MPRKNLHQGASPLHSIFLIFTMHQEFQQYSKPWARWWSKGDVQHPQRTNNIPRSWTGDSFLHRNHFCFKVLPHEIFKMSTTVDMSADQGVLINTVAWLFTGIAIVAVSLKLFTRSQTVKILDWDDFFIFLSMVRSLSISWRVANETRYAALLLHRLSPIQCLWVLEDTRQKF